MAGFPGEHGGDVLYVELSRVDLDIVLATQEGGEGLAETGAGKKVSLNQLWNRRHCTKFNGVSYPVQKGAAATYSKEGAKQVKERITYYLNNAEIIRTGLNKSGFETFGGINAPYIWLKTPNNIPSWDFFDKLLTEANVVGTPGAGFGKAGEGYFRLSAFGDQNSVKEAIKRITAISF